MRVSRTNHVAFWICTALVAFFMISGGLANVFLQASIAGFIKLGYPAYFARILGVWKVLGGIAILAPRFPRLKEWAYAGMTFELTGAAITDAVAGDVSQPPRFATSLVSARWRRSHVSCTASSASLAEPNMR